MSPEDQKTILDAAQRTVTEEDLYGMISELHAGAPGYVETSATLSSTLLKALVLEVLVHRERQGILKEEINLSGAGRKGEVN